MPQPLAFWSDPIILEFAFGMALGWASAEGFFLNRPVRLGFALAGLALMALDLTQPGELLALPRPLAYGLPAAFLVASAALASPERRGAENPLIRWGVILGDASYALYLLHPFVIRALRELVTRTAIAALVGPWGFVMLSILCAAAAAIGVNRVFERPITRATRQLLGPSAASLSFKELAREAEDRARGRPPPRVKGLRHARVMSKEDGVDPFREERYSRRGPFARVASVFSSIERALVALSSK